jgi:cytidylate kinase
MTKKINIAIDGPAGSGKSTTARLLANKLSYNYLDTGATYRVATYLWILNDKQEIIEYEKIFNNAIIEIKFDNFKQLTFLNNEDISEEIRMPEVTANVSYISSIGFVREKLVELQRQFAKSKGVVIDGRDIGTVVLPNAELKIYLVASIEERAKRRALELNKMGVKVNFDEIKLDIERRDKLDSEREISPLRKADDAIEIDTTGMTIGDQVNHIYELGLNVINGLI